MILVAMQLIDGKVVHINPKYIQFVRSTQDERDGTIIRLVDNVSFVVDLQIQQVLSRIAIAQEGAGK